jgi:hypothetical protein
MCRNDASFSAQCVTLACCALVPDERGKHLCPGREREGEGSTCVSLARLSALALLAARRATLPSLRRDCDVFPVAVA